MNKTILSIIANNNSSIATGLVSGLISGGIKSIIESAKRKFSITTIEDVNEMINIINLLASNSVTYQFATNWFHTELKMLGEARATLSAFNCNTTEVDNKIREFASNIEEQVNEHFKTPEGIAASIQMIQSNPDALKSIVNAFMK